MISKTQLQEMGFNGNHALLLLAGVVVFILLLLPRVDIKLSAMFSKADENKKTLTYEQVRDEVYAQMGLGSSDDYLQQLENQFALLDRGMADGAVLGEMIGLGEIPSASEINLPEVNQRYPIILSSDNSAQAVTFYRTQVASIESSYNKVGIMAELNSNDKQALLDSTTRWRAMLEELSTLSVPVSQQAFHKNLLHHYYAVLKMGEVYAGAGNEAELGLFLKIMIATANEIS